MARDEREVPKPVPQPQPMPDTPAPAEPAQRGALSRLRAVSQREREELLATASHERIQELESENQRLRRLVDVSREISSKLDPHDLLPAILDEAIALVGAERGFVLLREGQGFQTVLARGASENELGPEASRTSETLARRCLDLNAVVTFDALDQYAELREAKSIQALDTSQAVVLPLRQGGSPKGVLYLDSAHQGMLQGEETTRLLEAFASQAAVSMLNAHLMQQLEESRRLLERQNETLSAEVRGGARFPNLIGTSSSLTAIHERIRLLKDVDISILIEGESGTGKEVVARTLHFEGARRARPFVPVNCGAIPRDLVEATLFGHVRGAFSGAVRDNPGLVEEADGGTLFLDEVGDLPLEMQVKLLRFLADGTFRRVGDREERRSTPRVLAATNRDLNALVAAGQFRDDLLFRLDGVRLHLPPLRDRMEDVPALIDHYLAVTLESMPRRVNGMTARARAMLLQYSWPGNVRQLIRTIRGAAALVEEGNAIDEEQIRIQVPELGPAPDLRPLSSEPLASAMDDAERAHLERQLQESGWNITKAAKALGISRQHLHNRIRHHHLSRP